MGKVAKTTKKFNRTLLTGELKRRRQVKRFKAKVKGRGGGTVLPEKPVDEADSQFGYQSVAGADGAEPDDDLLGALEEVEESDLEGELDSEAREDGGGGSDGDEAQRHKLDLEALKEADPEFYEFLQQNDSALLDFNASEDESHASEPEGSVEEEPKRNPERTEGELSMAQIAKWEVEIQENRCIKALRQLVLAFEAGAHIGEADFNSRCPYVICGDRLFNKLMVTCLRQVPATLDFHLISSPSGAPSTSPKWSNFQPLVKTFLSSILHMFSVENSGDMLKYLLETTNLVIRYLACDEKLARMFLKVLLERFGGSGEPELQTASFSLIRKLALLCPVTLEHALRGVYAVLVRHSRNLNCHTVTRVNVIRSCAVELFGHNFDKSYQLAFTCIRQLAVHLRACLTTRTREAFAKVYNWQFIQSLSFWAHVLSTYCDRDVVSAHGESPLQPLIYPLTQVALGTISLIPSPKYFPLRFQCVRAMTLLAHKTQTYIPTIPYLIEVLESVEFQRQPAPSTLKPFNIALALKVPKSYLRTRVYQDMLTEELNELLLGYFAAISNNIGFPEIALPTLIYLKKFLKASKSVKVNKKVEQILAKVLAPPFTNSVKVGATSAMILAKRSGLAFAPADLAAMSAFLPGDAGAKTPVQEYYESVAAFKAQRQVLIAGAAESE
ncbi:Nucleolar Complex 2 protein [Massospora cicadina]|nr:Nucleolar Complex 2 protein [Massospora cicadina]